AANGKTPVRGDADKEGSKIGSGAIFFPRVFASPRPRVVWPEHRRHSVTVAHRISSDIQVFCAWLIARIKGVDRTISTGTSPHDRHGVGSDSIRTNSSTAPRAHKRLTASHTFSAIG